MIIQVNISYKPYLLTMILKRVKTTKKMTNDIK